MAKKQIAYSMCGKRKCIAASVLSIMHIRVQGSSGGQTESLSMQTIVSNGNRIFVIHKDYTW